MSFAMRMCCLAAVAAAVVSSPVAAATVTVDLTDLKPLGNEAVIETVPPGFGSQGPVTLNWNPESHPATEVRFLNKEYSGDDAGWCGDTFAAVCLIDLGTNLSVASGSASVLPSTPFEVSVGVSSATGFRLAYGPDGFNAGITGLTYSYTEATVVPLPAAGLLLAGAMGGLVELHRRRRAA